MIPGALLAAVASCSLTGTVRTADGAVARAHVVARGATPNAADSDAAGRFGFDVPCGAIRLTVVAPGYATTDVELEARDASAVEIVLEPLGGGRLREIGRVTVDGRLALSHSTVPTRSIGRAELDAAGFDLVAQALANVPSVTLARPNGGGSGATTVVALRGPDPSETRIALDGQPLNDTSTGDFDLATFPTALLSAIDVSEGLGAEDARGADTIGGEINLVSLRPTATPQRSARFALGSFGTTEAAISATGRAGRLGYALALGDRQRAGYVRNYPATFTLAGANGNPYVVSTPLSSASSARTALANVTYDLSPRASLRVRVLSAADVRELDASVNAPTDPAQAAPGAAFSGGGPQTVRHDLRASLATLTVPLGAGSLVATGAVSSATRAEALPFGGGAPTPYDFALTDRLGSASLEWTRTQERATLALGAQLRGESLDSPDQGFASAQRQHASLAWLRANAELAPHLRVGASVVESKWSTFAPSLDGRLGIERGDVFGGTLRFAVGTGFRAPLLAEQAVLPAAALAPDGNCVAAQGNPHERAEHATEYELGYGRRFGATTVDASVYRTNLRDPIENFYPAGAACAHPGVSETDFLSYPVNVGTVVYRGGALRLAHRFGPGYWSATGEYAVNAAYPTSLPDAVSAANPTSGSTLVPGQQFAGIPLQQYAVGVRYARAGLHGALSLAGKSRNNELAQSGFATLDGALGRSWGRVDLTVAGTNLTNAAAGRFTRLGQGTAYPIPGGLVNRDALVLEPAALRLILTLR